MKILAIFSSCDWFIRSTGPAQIDKNSIETVGDN